LHGSFRFLWLISIPTAGDGDAHWSFPVTIPSVGDWSEVVVKSVGLSASSSEFFLEFDVLYISCIDRFTKFAF
jgi:hypothetical protein